MIVTEGQTDRHKGRADTETAKQRDRYIEKDKERDRKERKSDWHTETDRHTDRHKDRSNMKTEIHKHKKEI